MQTFGLFTFIQLYVGVIKEHSSNSHFLIQVGCVPAAGLAQAPLTLGH